MRGKSVLPKKKKEGEMLGKKNANKTKSKWNRRGAREEYAKYGVCVAAAETPAACHLPLPLPLPLPHAQQLGAPSLPDYSPPTYCSAELSLVPRASSKAATAATKTTTFAKMRRKKIKQRLQNERQNV